MSFSSSIQSVCLNKSEGVDNLVGNKIFILAGKNRVFAKQIPSGHKITERILISL